MAIETTSLGTKNAYGPRRRPETIGGAIGGVDTAKQIVVQTTGVAAEVAIVPYWPNAKWKGTIGNATVPTGLTVGLYSVNAAGALTVLTADAAFAAAVFTTATTGIDAKAAGEMAAGVTGLVLRFTAASAAGRLAFEVETDVITPKTLAATR